MGNGTPYGGSHQAIVRTRPDPRLGVRHRHGQTGRAIMVFTADNEQGFDFAVYGHDWIPVDYEGLHLVLRPHTDTPKPQQQTGWSNAAKRRRYGKT